MGVGRHASVVYLIDFGLSKEYRDPNTHQHIPFNNGLGFIGTAAFASINSYLGLELERQDDLESLAYILFYFLWGFLLWQGSRPEEQEFLESKQGITTLDLYRGLLPEFHTFFEHCRLLSFDSKPNYDHFCHLFNNLSVKEGPRGDVAFDWDVAGAKISEQDLKITCDVPPHERKPSFKRRMG